MVDMQEATFEALCSALYSLEFTRFLGERPDPVTKHGVAWFRLSRDPSQEVSARSDPKQVMVAVRREEAGIVALQVGWLNLTSGLDHPTRGEQTLRISTMLRAQPDIMSATEAAILRVLQIYQDVLTEKGVAGPIHETAPESFAGDPDDPDDMAVKE